MTTKRGDDERCCVCGTQSRQPVFVLTNPVGLRSDLDARPPESLRSTMSMWVQRCPSCGYCAPRLSQGPENAKACVDAGRYQSFLRDPYLPKLTTTFLCHSFVCQAGGSFSLAGHARLWAAWACDDAGKDRPARMCRRGALALFKAARKRGQAYAQGPIGEPAIVADLLRRTREFEEAIALCAAEMGGLEPEPTWTVLRYELILAVKRDDGAHTMQEALDNLRAEQRHRREKGTT